ncbi:hypothetical protein C9374_009294 [Naegleria lovaniensis]|uniref:F-box/LRR-repeat protein 15/At3g58940/PEG3-like LRR domain-containing protein n=1 Tax=Naegleria lovaniensis TaxID=51637 RepID=A0AA88KH28_NAELO|nr:uncharacterized protein C9374_009294 [Naegleria lovaniensis]KAG2377383.1 hypothetical protein C9374_009294 [Naegleria lovaniensis]
MFKLFEFDEEESNEWISWSSSPSSSSSSSLSVKHHFPHLRFTNKLLHDDTILQHEEEDGHAKRTFNLVVALPKDVWTEIFSFLSTHEKLTQHVFICKPLNDCIYQSITSLKLIGIEASKESIMAQQTMTRNAYSEDDKWLMMPYVTPSPSTTSNALSQSVVTSHSQSRSLSYASRMSSLRRMKQSTQVPSSTSSSSLTSLSDVFKNELILNQNPLVRILEPFSKLTHLSIEFSKALTGEALSLILNKFSHLESLSLIHCNELKFIHITFPMAVCSHLKKLEIRDCRNIQEYCGGLKIDCHLLKYLTITSTPCVNDRFLSNLIERNASTLQHISLFGLHDFSHLCMGKRMSELVQLSLERCKNFSKFHLPIKQVCTVFPALVDLDLSYTQFNDESFKSLTHEQRLDHLQVLTLEGCKQLKKPTVGVCKSLHTMNFDLCSDLEAVTIPSGHCPSLRNLSMNNTRMNDKSLERIFNANNHRGVSIEDYQNGLVSPPISKLSAKKCKLIFNPKITSYHLEELDLNGCFNCSSVKVVDLSKQSLKKLNLGWTKISDDDLNKIVTTCPSLTELSLNTCDNLVNPHIESQSLKKISFTGAHFLHNPVFKCDKLQQVDFRNCDNLESPTLVRKKRSKTQERAGYNVVRRLNFDECLPATSNSSDCSPSTVMQKHTPILEAQDDDNDYCPSPNMLHPKMKVIEEDEDNSADHDIYPRSRILAQ